MLPSAEEGVSVIIPAYNAAEFVADAIMSAYDQTVPPSEVIVVDDGSTDETGEVLRRLATELPPTFHCVTKANRGPGSARNAGVDIARSKYVAFLDSDDVWARQKLERHLEHFEAKPELTLSFTARAIVNLKAGHDDREEVGSEQGEGVAHALAPDFAGVLSGAAQDASVFRLDPDAIPPMEVLLSSLMEHPTIGTSSAVMIVRSALARVPKFNESSSVDDWTMWLQLASRGMKFGFIPEPLVKYRWRGDNLTSDRLRQLCDICDMLDAFGATNGPPPATQEKIGLRWWRSHWHLIASVEARMQDRRKLARQHIIAAARIRPASIRPGWLRMLGLGSAPSN